ncbi:hypothetical protein [Lentzea fradiae]|nr:hypothetical protein [Lentzea fradiae]
MSDSGRDDQRPAATTSDRHRFLRSVAVVTGSRQVSLSQLDQRSPRPRAR